MVLSGRQKISLWVFLGYLGAVILDPLITIFRLNVENWAAENEVDRLLVDGAPELSERIMSYLAQIAAVGVGGVADTIGVVASPVGLAFVAGGLFVGLAPYLREMSGDVKNHFKGFVTWGEIRLYLPFGASPERHRQASTPQAPKDDRFKGQNLIPEGIRVEGERHRDGVDLTLIITIRNRSLSPLQIRLKRADWEIAGVEPENKGGISCSGDMQPSSGQNIRFAKIRLFHPTDFMTGSASAALTFRSGQSKDKYSLRFRYTLTVTGMPSANGKFEIKDIEAELETPIYKAIPNT